MTCADDPWDNIYNRRIRSIQTGLQTVTRRVLTYSQSPTTEPDPYFGIKIALPAAIKLSLELGLFRDYATTSSQMTASLCHRQWVLKMTEIYHFSLPLNETLSKVVAGEVFIL